MGQGWDIKELREKDKYKDKLTDKNIQQLMDFKKYEQRKARREEEKSKERIFGTENLKNEAEKLSLSKVNKINS
jgi:transcription initiation factor TFIIIB Brf1 subunit/transcription initiation factor TFIIB